MAIEKEGGKIESTAVTKTAATPEEDFVSFMHTSLISPRLSFPAALETEFVESYYKRTNTTMRWAFVAGFILYVIFGWLDLYVAPISINKVWMIRFGMACPVLLLIVLFTYIKKLWPVMQFAGSVAGTVGGLGVSLIIMVTEPGEVAYEHYYSGLILVMLFTSSWLRLRFWYALSTNTIIMISYELVAIYVQHLPATKEGSVLFLSNNFLLLGTYIIAAFANYWLERHIRIDFLQQKIIEAEKNKVNNQRVTLEQQAQKLSTVISSLKQTQSRLVNSEKLASLGELTAGIAHEIKNPLNFVTNFSEVSIELINEFEKEINNNNKEEVLAIAQSLKDNMEKIAYHGKRADSIIKSMLLHSRTGSGEKMPTDINNLIDEYFRLSYQGLRARDKSFNTVLATDLDPAIGDITIVAQDIGRVLLNLFTNAFYSVNKKKKNAGDSYQPKVSVSSKKENGFITIRVRDNGLGISPRSMGKIFQPFFTTKPAGEGIGLGLSLSHEIIVKGHGGSMNVDSSEGEFAEFVINIPV